METNYKAKIHLYGETIYLDSNYHQLINDIASIYPQITKEIDSTPSHDTLTIIRKKAITIFYNEELVFTANELSGFVTYIEWFINNYFLEKFDYFYQIHAGSVAINNFGILFPATNDTGKSTFTFFLLHKKFQFLSDEIGLINPQTHHLFPFPKSLSLDTPLSITPFNNRLKYNLTSINHSDKLYYQTEIKDDHLANGVPLRYIFFLTRNTASNDPLSDCPKGQGLIELIKNSFNPVMCNEDNFNQFIKLIPNVKTFFLDISDLDRAYESICEVIHYGNH